jgi:hypothetical protein
MNTITAVAMMKKRAKNPARFAMPIPNSEKAMREISFRSISNNFPSRKANTFDKHDNRIS